MSLRASDLDSRHREDERHADAHVGDPLDLEPLRERCSPIATRQATLPARAMATNSPSVAEIGQGLHGRCGCERWTAMGFVRPRIVGRARRSGRGRCRSRTPRRETSDQNQRPGASGGLGRWPSGKWSRKQIAEDADDRQEAPRLRTTLPTRRSGAAESAARRCSRIETHRMMNPKSRPVPRSIQPA